jgi:hypothetical protein
MNPNFFFCDATAPGGLGPPSYRGFTITLRHTTLGRNPLDEWSARHRDLYLTAHSNQNTHPCQPRYSNPHLSKRAAADPHLRRRGHSDRPNEPYSSRNLDTVTTLVYLILLLELTMKRSEKRYPETALKKTHCIPVTVSTAPNFKRQSPVFISGLQQNPPFKISKFNTVTM